MDCVQKFIRDKRYKNSISMRGGRTVKRTIALLLVLCMLTTMLPAALAEEIVVTDIEETASVEMSDMGTVDVEDLDLAEGLGDIDLSLPAVDDLTQLDLDGDLLVDDVEGDLSDLDNATKSTVPSKLTLGQKQTYTLDTAVMAKGKKVTYTSNKSSVASVSDKGVIKADKKGKATITCKVGKKTLASCVVTVVSAPDNVKLDPASIELSVNGTYQIVPTLPTGTMASFTYSSKDTKVARVTENGLVTGVKAGQTTVIVKTHNKVTATLNVTVKKAQSSDPKAPGKVTLDIHKSTLSVGDTLQLKAALPKGTASVLTWKSNKTAVATVSNEGKVTAAGTGTAKITVSTANGKTDTCEITVKKAPDKVTIKPDKVTLAPGASIQLSATLPKGTTSDLTWTSDKKSVATVNENGLVTAVKSGTAKITVKTYNGVKDICTVTVKSSASTETKAPSKVTLDISKANLCAGETLQLTATLPKGTSSVLTWESDNPAVATVKNGLVTAVDTGKATITVTTGNKKSDTCDIVVKKLPDKVKLNVTKMTLVPMETFDLVASLPTGTTSELTWKSSKPSVAKVNDEGLVTAVKTGTAKITVTTVNKKTATCTVTVETPSLVSASASKSSFTIAPEETAKLQVKTKCVRNPALNYSWTVNGEDISGAYGSSYTAVGGNAGSYEYVCVVSDGTNSEKVTFKVKVDNDLKAEATSATEQTVFVGKSAVLSASGSCAVGEPTYQWYVGDTPIDGATGSSYTTDPVNAQTVFTCAVGDEYGSAPVKLDFTVSVKPRVLTEAVAETASFQLKPTEKATLRVNASGVGEPNLSYKWFLNGAEIPGATGASYEVTAGNVGSYTYKCTVSDGANAKDVTFTVNVANGLTASEKSATSQTVFTGDAAKLEVSASCHKGGATYQWYRGDAAISGATGASYAATENTAGSYAYKCEVGDAYGSDKVTVSFTVNVKARTLTGASAETASINLKPAEQATLRVNTTGDGNPPLTYKWTLNGAEISGATGSTYTVTAGNVGSYAYKCTVSDGVNAMDVAFTVNVNNSLTASAKGAASPTIFTGKTATLEVSASAATGDRISYKWYRGDAAIEGATGASYVATENAAGSYAYKCEVNDGYGSDAVTVSFTVTAKEPSLTGASAQKESQTVAPTQSATLTVVPVCDGEPNLSYAWYAGEDTTPISGADGASYTVTAGNVGVYAYRCVVSDDNTNKNEKTVAFTVNVNNSFSAEAKGAASPSIFTGQTATLEVKVNAATGDKVSCKWYAGEDLENAIGTGSSYTTEAIATAGTYGYTCVVDDGYGSEAATVGFTVSAREPSLTDASTETPSFNLNPKGQAALTVETECDGEPNLSYKWYLGEDEIDGADGASYTVTAGNVGVYAYTCVVSDDNTNKNEKTVSFTVNVTNGFSASAADDTEWAVLIGEAATLEVSVSAATRDKVSYQWYKGDAAIDGATGASYAVTEDAAGSYAYKCEVNDGYGSDTVTVSFTVTVREPSLTSASAKTATFTVAPTEQAALIVETECDGEPTLSYAWYEGEDTTPISGATGSSYTVTAGNVGEYTYKCTASDDNTNKNEITVSFTVTVDNGFTAAAKGSTKKYILTGETATLEVSATAATRDKVSYQWYKGDAEIDGATGASYDATEDVLGDYAYKCVVDDGYGSDAVTVDFTVSVREQSLTGASAVTASFTVAPTQEATLEVVPVCAGEPALSYAWYQGEDTTPIDGADGASYTVTAGNVGEYVYKCVVSDGNADHDQEVSFTVTVDNGFTASAETATSQSVRVGETAMLEVIPSATMMDRISYQWFKGDSAIEGATGASYAAVEDEAGEYAYKCVVSDGYGSASITIEFTITATQQEQNEPKPLQLDVPATATISEEGQIAYFYFTPEETNKYIFASSGSADTYGYLYDADMVQLASDDDGGDGDNFRIEQRLTAGTTYYFGVRYYSREDLGTINVLLSAFQGLIEVSTEQSVFNVALNTEVTLQVNAKYTAGESVTYLWYKRDDNGYRLIDGETEPTYTLTATSAATYWCYVSDTRGNEKRVDFEVNIENGFTATAMNGEEEMDLTANLGDTLKLDVTARCTTGNLYYQWYYGYEDFDAADGATAATYTTMPIEMHYTTVYCQVSDDYGNRRYVYFYITRGDYVENNLWVRAVSSDVDISPTGVQALTVSVSATDMTDMTYRWSYESKSLNANGYWDYGDWVSIPAADDQATCTLSGADIYSTYYRCEVTDRYHNSKTAYFDVTVQNNLTANGVNGTDLYVLPNQTVELETEATCDYGRLSYQWYEEKRYEDDDDTYWAAIDGATNASRTTGAITADARFRCRVADDYMNARTVTFTVHVVDLSSATELSLNTSETVTVVDYSGTCKLFTYTPETTGWYDFRVMCNDGGEKYVTLLNRNGETIVTAKRYGDFRLTQKLTAGTKYYYATGYVPNDGYGTFTVVLEKNSVMDNSQALTLDTPATATISEGGQIAYFSFTPAETGYYVFTSSCGRDTYGYLYDANLVELAEDDDGGDDNNFRIAQQLTAGTAYYYGARYYNSSNTGDIEVLLSRVQGLIDARAAQDSFTVAPETEITLRVNAEYTDGESVTYQWYKNGEDDYELITGVTAPAYTLTATRATMYRCVVSDTHGNTRSVDFWIYIENGLTAKASNGESEQDLNAKMGEEVTLEVAASCATGGLSYQWYEEGNAIEGATAATYTTNPIHREETYCYCVVSDAYGSSRYVYFYITCDDYVDNELRVYAVNDEVYISPTGEETLAVSVSANDMTGMTYRWSYQSKSLNDRGDWEYGEWVSIPAADDQASFTLSGADAYSTTYRCEVTDNYYDSRTVHFYVTVDNDYYVGWDDDNTESLVPYNGTATVTAKVYYSSTEDLNYSWYFRENDQIKRFEGETNRALTVPSVTGHMYIGCVVTDAYWNRQSNWLNVYVENHLTAQAVGDTSVFVVRNETATLEVSADCDVGEINYQWYREKYVEGDGWYSFTLGTGATCTTDAITEDCTYYCSVSDQYGTTNTVYFYVKVIDPSDIIPLALGEDKHVTLEHEGERALFSFTPDVDGMYAFGSSDNDELTIRGTLFDENWNTVASNVQGGRDYNFCLVHHLEAGKPYYFGAWYEYEEWGSFSVRLDSFEAVPLTLSSQATVNISEYGQTVYFSFTPAQTGYYAFSSSNSDESTVGRLFDEDMQEIRRENGWNNFRIIQKLTGGKTYYLGTGFNYEDTGSFDVCVTAFQGLVNAEAEQSDFTVAPDTEVTLKVNAEYSDGETVTYRWYEDGNYETAIATNVATCSVTATHATIYRCEVSDTHGNTRSVDFRVNIENGLTARASNGESEQDLNAKMGKEVTLAVKASCTTGGLSYKWYESEAPIYGATEAAYTTKPIHRQYTECYCIVSDTYGNRAYVYFYITADDYVDNELEVYAVDEYVSVSPTGEQALEVDVSANDMTDMTYRWSYQSKSLNDRGDWDDGEWVGIPAADDQDSYVLSGAGAYTTTYRCEVTDRYYNSRSAYFYVTVDNYYYIGWDDDNTDRLVPYGDPATVTAKVYDSSTEDLNYSWYIRENGQRKRFEGETNKALTVPSVKGRMQIECVVTDTHWNRQSNGWDIGVENHLTAQAVGDTSVFVVRNETATLEVSADCDVGEINYQWYREKYVEGDGWYSFTLGTGATCTTDAITEDCTYYCSVSDQYGTTNTVYFYVKVIDPSDIIPLALGEDKHVTLEHEGERALFSFTPDVDGMYAFGSSDNDELTIRGTLFDENWNTVASNVQGGRDYNFCLVHHLEAGKPYYFGAWYEYEEWGSFSVRLDSINVTPLTLDTTENVTISEGGQTVYYSFTPAQTGYYAFSSNNTSNSTVGRLYDETMRQIGGETGWNNFHFTQKLAGGKTYYFGTGFNYDDTGSFEVCVTAFQGLISAYAEQSNFTVAPDTEITLQVNAEYTDGETVTYRWYEDGEYETASATTVSTHTFTATHATIYRCEVSDTHGNTSSVDFWIYIENGLTARASNGESEQYLTANMGTAPKLEVVANCTTGEPSYQWYEEGYAIDGATEETYTTKPIRREQTECYCIVTDVYGNNVYVHFYIDCDNYVDNDLQVEAVNEEIDISPTDEQTLAVDVVAYDKTGMTYRWSYQSKSLNDRGEWDYGDWVGIPAADDQESFTLSGADAYTTTYRCEVADRYYNTETAYFSVNVHRGLDMTWDYEHSHFSVAFGASATLVSQMRKDDMPTTVEDLTYSWYKRNGDNFERIDGATGTTYTVDSVKQRIDYRCVAVDDHWNSYSNSVEVSVQNNLYVRAANDETIFAVPYGGQVTLKVVAQYTTGPVEYHWYMWEIGNENRIDLDCNGDTYTIDQVTADSAYACAVTDSFGNRSDCEFSVTILDPSEAITLSLDTPVTSVPGTHWGEGILYTFTPQETGYYTLQGTGCSYGVPVYCALYDSALNKITREEEHYSVKLFHKLNAGEKYYFKTGYTIRYGGSDEYTVILTRRDDFLALTLDTPATVTIAEGGQTVYYSFTPAQTGYYAFSSSNGNEPTAGGLYDEAMRELKSDTGWNSFRIIRKLTAGNTYFFGARFYYEYVTDSFDLCVSAFQGLASAEAEQGTFTVAPDTSVTLQVNAEYSDGESLTYRWYQNGGEEPISGATGPAYTLTATRAEEYRCVVSDTRGNTKYVYFYINIENGFTARGKHGEGDEYLNANMGETQTLEVVASCATGELSYQWYEEYTEIDGATKESYTTKPIHRENTDVRCRVSDIYGNYKDVYFYITCDNYVDNDLHVEAVNEYVYISPTDEQTLAVDVVAYDKTGMTYRWSYQSKSLNDRGEWDYGDWVGIPAADDQESFTLSGADAYTTTYRCEVADTYYNTQTAYFYVTVDNNYYVGWDYDNTDSLVPYDSPATVTAKVTDSSTEDLNYTWYLYENDQLERFEGETNKALTVPSVKGRMEIECVVTDAYWNRHSNRLDVGVENHLTAQAVGDSYVYVAPNATATLQVSANCDVGDIDYQWYKEAYVEYEGGGSGWQSVALGKGETCTTDAITAYCNYHCEVSDQYGTTRTVYFYIYIDNALTAQARDGVSSFTIFAGDNVTLEVVASAHDEEGMTFRWQKYEPDGYGWMYIDDQTAATLALPAVSESARYSCNVADRYGNQCSVFFSVKVINSSNIVPLTLGEEKSVTIEKVGDTALFSYTPDADSVYMFGSSNNGNLTIRGTLFDENWNTVASNVEGGQDYNFRVVHLLEAGKPYYLAAWHEYDETGSFSVRLDSFDATPLTLGSTAAATISEGGQIAYFSFVPETTGDYQFASSGEIDTYGYLYDANLVELAEDDDSGDDSNFRITQQLTAGTTYYFGARYYSSGNMGTISVLLSLI